jgi:hypothetical protein
MASFVYKCNDAACKSCATLVVRKMDCVTRCMEHVQTHFPSRPLIKSDWGLLTASISLDTTRQSGSVDWTMSKSMNVVQCPGESKCLKGFHLCKFSPKCRGMPLNHKISHMLRKTDLAESEGQERKSSIARRHPLNPAQFSNPLESVL